jgi:hypothetical protein
MCRSRRAGHVEDAHDGLERQGMFPESSAQGRATHGVMHAREGDAFITGFVLEMAGRSSVGGVHGATEERKGDHRLNPADHGAHGLLPVRHACPAT